MTKVVNVKVKINVDSLQTKKNKGITKTQ